MSRIEGWERLLPWREKEEAVVLLGEKIACCLVGRKKRLLPGKEKEEAVAMVGEGRGCCLFGEGQGFCHRGSRKELLSW